MRRLESSPVLTKALTSGALSVVAEVLARTLACKPLRSSSALHEFTIGLLLRGPVIHYFHMLLDQVVFAQASNQRDTRIVLAKLAIDQLLFAPVFISGYLYLSGLMVDVPLAVTSRRIKKELLGVLKSNWVVWVPANFVGYYFVPLQLRVAWASLVGVAWTAFLIAKTSRNSPTNTNSLSTP